MEISYTNEDGKLKITTNVTQELVIDKDSLIREREDILQRLASAESVYAREKRAYTDKIVELDQKIAKCTELGIKSQAEILEENLSQ